MTLVACLLAVALALLAPPASAADYDLVLRGGELYRGGITLAGRGDVAIRGDRIVAVGEVPGRGAREVDVSGRIVAPGFIDLHNHTDEIYRRFGGWPLPGALHHTRNYLTQGVTTLVTGNCGSGPAKPDEVEGWLSRVDALPLGTNVAHLVAHGQLRFDAMGEGQADREDPHPSPEELATMKAWVAESMAAGAFGLSTGLVYDPGARAGTLEIVELTRQVAAHGGIYASHTRHEGPDPVRMFASYAEAITIGQQAGVPVHISHIKLHGKATHGLTPEVLGLVAAARARGERVTADHYPYAASSAMLAFMVPAELRDGPSAHDRFCADEEGRARLRAGAERFLREDTPPESVQVSLYPRHWTWQNRRLSEVAADRGQDPADLAVEMACGWIGFGIYHSQHRDDVRAFAQQDWVATASDGTAMVDFLGRFVHPRAYGTFPRKLRRFALDEGVVTLAFALRSMTELPADVLGLADRGRLEPDAFADVVVFDPKTIRDLATFERSGVHSEGIDYLLVNGVLAIDGGALTAERAGRALRNPRRQAAAP